MQYSTVLYSTVQYSTVQYNTVQYSTVQPYHSLLLLVNTDTREYIFRVLGTTRERGFYTDMEDLKVENGFIYHPISLKSTCILYIPLLICFIYNFRI